MSHFKVLFVDDDKQFLDMLEPNLEDVFQVKTATSPLEAIEYCQSETFDAVVVDIDMPLMNGFELMAEIKKIQPDAVYFFLTCFTDDPTYLESLSLDPDDFLNKPITAQRLSAALSHRLQKQMAKATLNYGNLSYCVENGIAEIDSRRVELTKKEGQILQILMKSPQKRVPKERMLESLWGHVSVSQHTLDTHLSNLRRKIAPAGLQLIVDRERQICLMES